MPLHMPVFYSFNIIIIIIVLKKRFRDEVLASLVIPAPVVLTPLIHNDLCPRCSTL